MVQSQYFGADFSLVNSLVQNGDLPIFSHRMGVCPAAQLSSAARSVLKANATTRKRLTSHGEEFGASCSAEGDVLEHIFRRCPEREGHQEGSGRSSKFHRSQRIFNYFWGFKNSTYIYIICIYVYSPCHGSWDLLGS